MQSFWHPQVHGAHIRTSTSTTADAAHTNRNHANYLHERGGHYLLTAKLNQCATRRSVTSPLEAGQTRREVCWV